MSIESIGYVVTKVSLHTIGFFDFIQDVSSFSACDQDAAAAAAALGDLIHPVVAEMPLEA